MPFDATVKGTSANSYLTVEEADTILTEQRLHAGATWDALTTAEKQAALMWATRILDSSMDWKGSIRTETQRLRWPRAIVPDRDGRWLDYDTIPDVLKEVTAEFAYLLASRDRSVEPLLVGLGLVRAKVDVIEVEVAPDQVLDLIPAYILRMLDPLGSPLGTAGGDSVVKLSRA